MPNLVRNGFQLDRWTIYPLNGRIESPDGEQHVQPKVMEVLVSLAENAGDVVTREELLSKIWGGTYVSDEVLTRCISELRHHFGDHADHPRIVQTVPKRGYRLVQKVTPLRAKGVGEPAAPYASTADEYLSPGKTGSLIGELKRRNVLHVAASYAIIGWLSIQVADITFDKFGFPPAVAAAFVKLVILGFPIALILSWFLQITSRGVTIDEGGGTLRISHRINIAVAGMIVLAAMLAIWHGVSGNGDKPKQIEFETAANSVAVLRFVDLDNSPETRSFSDGLSEDVLNKLARLDEMLVASRGDAWSLPENADSKMVRSRLRVRYFLEGSVRQADDNVRVVAQLIDTDNGFHIWSQSYDREMTGLFRIQNEISLAVVQALELVLSPVSAKNLAYEKDTDLRAYEEYRLGRNAFFKPASLESLAKAEDHYRQAIEYEPGYADAHAGICEINVSRYVLTRDDSNIAPADRACHLALELDPRLGVVHEALGNLYRRTGRANLAELAFENAIEVNSRSVRAYRGLANIFATQGRLDDAEATFVRALELQPGNWAAYADYGLFLLGEGRYDESISKLSIVVELTPYDAPGHSNLGAAYLLNGDLDPALDSFLTALKLEETRASAISNVGLVYYYLGRFDEAVSMFENASVVTPDDHRVWGNLGSAQKFAGMESERVKTTFTRAIDLARQWIDLHPDDAEALSDLALYFSVMGDAGSATRIMNQAEDKGSGRPGIYFSKAMVLAQIGDIDAAMTALEQALDLGYATTLIDSEPMLNPLQKGDRLARLLNNNED